jgi:probable phosphoglycerate mutase
LYARSGSFIHDVLTPEVVSGKNVLIVAHGALDCSLICQYEEIPLEHFWDQLLGNCELRRLVSSANV